MKKLLLYILFFISFGIFSQTSKVSAEIDTKGIRIGEQFVYAISIDEVDNVVLPKLRDLKGLEVIDTLKTDTLKRALVQKYIMTGFDSGAFYIPQQQVLINNQVYLTDSLLVNVATIPVDTTKVKMFEIKGIKGEPYQFDDYKHILFWVLGILLLVGVVLFFALKRTKNDEIQISKSILTPYQEALKGLKSLDGKLLWQNNKIKEYYSELSGVVRNYIERELNVQAMETTTDGLIEQLSSFKDSESILTDKETISKLDGLLKQADLVKFAKSKPLAHQIEGDRNIAEHIINNIKPNIVESDIDVVQIETVQIVEKPVIKNPSLLVKIIMILLLLLLVFGLVYLAIPDSQMSNSVNPPSSYVQ